MKSYSTTTSSIKEKCEHILDKDFSLYVNKLLGKGGFGQLYLGRNHHDNTYVAIKVEDQSSRSRLIYEYEILKEISEGDGIPKV